MAQETTGKDGGKDAIKLTTRGKVVKRIGIATLVAANLAVGANIVDRGLMVEEQGPIAPNPALVGGEQNPTQAGQGQITTESGQPVTVITPDTVPVTPPVPNINQVPQPELPNAQNGPGLHST